MAKGVIGIIGESSTEMDIIIKEVVEKIEKAIDELNVTMAGTVGGLGGSVEADLIALNETLRESGFLTIAGGIINESFTNAINNAGQLNATLNNRVFEFSADSIKKMKALKHTTFNSVKDAVSAYTGKINNGINAVRFGGDSAQIVKDIGEVFGKTLKNQAKTLIDTGVSASWREANVLLAEDNGLDRFIYSGSLIPTSRAFCIEHLHKIRTVKEWNSLSNGQGLSPITSYLGGYNCRHSLVGVSATSSSKKEAVA